MKRTQLPAEHLQQIAQRMVNAAIGFREVVKSIIHCTDEDAAKVLQVYERLKIVKLDAVNGTYRVTHGAYLDPETLRNAASYH